MLAFVQSNQVLEVNGEYFSYPNNIGGISKQIPCGNVQIICAYWIIPMVQGGIVIGYNKLVATDSSKPTPDSVKVLAVKDKQDQTEYMFAILDADQITTSTFAEYCDGSGGTLPVMPTVTIPYPIMQNGPQSTASDGTNTFIFPVPTNPNGNLYSIPYIWFNGVAPGTAYVAAGITTLAGIVTYANTNWGDYGTWSAAGTALQLESATSDTVPVTEAGMEVSLAPANFCITVAGPYAVNGVKFGSSATIPFPAFVLSTSNRQTLINSLKPLMPMATFTLVSTNKIQISTVQAQPKIYDGSTLRITAATGAC